MIRILLVIEDLNQLNSIKVILSKLGCVIETLNVELGLRDRVLSFRPEVVITASAGKKVNPLSVCQKVREVSKDTKVLLLLGKGSTLSLNELAESKYDAFVETPFEPLKLISTLNQFNKGKNGVDLVEKYQKISGVSLFDAPDVRLVNSKKSTLTDDRISVFSGKFHSSVTDEIRAKSYVELTKDLTFDPKSKITKVAAKKKVAELQKDWDRAQLDEIDEEKRRFTQELFRKK